MTLKLPFPVAGRSVGRRNGQRLHVHLPQLANDSGRRNLPDHQRLSSPSGRIFSLSGKISPPHHRHLHLHQGLSLLPKSLFVDVDAVVVIDDADVVVDDVGAVVDIIVVVDVTVVGAVVIEPLFDVFNDRLVIFFRLVAFSTILGLNYVILFLYLC